MSVVKVSGNSPNRPMQILSLGMAKTGTWSMADAYRILGYKNVYHALEAVLAAEEDYLVFGEANKAVFPTLSSYTGGTFSREKWDEIFAPVEAVTDISAFYAASLIEAYPEAKIVLVERDIETWYASWCTALDMACGDATGFISTYIHPFIGITSGRVAKEFHLGWSEAKSLAEAKVNARRCYREHYARIRKMVPKERLLEYRLGDGWEPLCEFLGRPVPDESFPRRNESEQFKKMVPKLLKLHGWKMCRIYGPWVGLIGSVLIARSIWT